MTEEIKEKPAGDTQAEPEVKEQASVETGEQTPQFWLDEEGNLHGIFDDWGVEESGKETVSTDETKEEKVKPQEEKSPSVIYYTPEELAKLELHQINPERIPPELKPYYEAILKAEVERKKAEEKLQVSQPQLGDPKQFYDYIQAEAKKRVEIKLGEPFNELNPKHLTALAIEATQLAQELQKKVIVQQKITDLQKQEPYFQQIIDYMKTKMEDLPAKEYRNLMNAIQTDDFDTFYKYFDQMRKEFYKEKLGKTLEAQIKPQPQPQTKTSPEPPKVEEAGKGEVNTEPGFNPKDFAYMTEDEQVEALIKLGLV